MFIFKIKGYYLSLKKQKLRISWLRSLSTSRQIVTTEKIFFQQHHKQNCKTRIIITSFRKESSSSSSSSSLSDDRFKASSKTIRPYNTIQSFLLQMRVSSSVLKVIQQLLTSSSLSSCHFCFLFHLSINNLF